MIRKSATVALRWPSAVEVMGKGRAPDCVTTVEEPVARRRGFQWQVSHKLGLQIARDCAKRPALNTRGRTDKTLS